MTVVVPSGQGTSGVDVTQQATEGEARANSRSGTLTAVLSGGTLLFAFGVTSVAREPGLRIRSGSRVAYGTEVCSEAGAVVLASEGDVLGQMARRSQPN